MSELLVSIVIAIAYKAMNRRRHCLQNFAPKQLTCRFRHKTCPSSKETHSIY
jgi:hypothetical protein